MISGLLSGSQMIYQLTNFYPMDWVIVSITSIYLICVIWMDICSFRIPMYISIIGLAIAITWTIHFAHPINALIGGLIALIWMSILYLGGKVYRRIIPDKDSSNTQTPLGFGDVPFGAVMGVFMGWPGVIIGMAASFLLAGMVGVFVLLSRAHRSGQQKPNILPMAPFLVAGWIISLLFQ